MVPTFKVKLSTPLKINSIIDGYDTTIESLEFKSRATIKDISDMRITPDMSTTEQVFRVFKVTCLNKLTIEMIESINAKDFSVISEEINKVFGVK